MSVVKVKLHKTRRQEKATRRHCSNVFNFLAYGLGPTSRRTKTKEISPLLSPLLRPPCPRPLLQGTAQERDQDARKRRNDHTDQASEPVLDPLRQRHVLMVDVVDWLAAQKRRNQQSVSSHWPVVRHRVDEKKSAEEVETCEQAQQQARQTMLAADEGSIVLSFENATVGRQPSLWVVTTGVGIVRSRFCYIVSYSR